jgi:hypothetical protein
METLWVFVATINGLVLPPPGTTDEDRAGIVFLDVTQSSAMHFDNEADCNAGREKLIAGKAGLAVGLQNVTLTVTECKAVEYTVNEQQ